MSATACALSIMKNTFPSCGRSCHALVSNILWWGSALTHHPHVHGIVAGGGLAPDGKPWVACRHGFFLPVRVLSRLMRRRFLEEVSRLHQAGRLKFFCQLAALADDICFNK